MASTTWSVPLSYQVPTACSINVEIVIGADVLQREDRA
jgi:hypothetical protein